MKRCYWSKNTLIVLFALVLPISGLYWFFFLVKESDGIVKDSVTVVVLIGLLVFVYWMTRIEPLLIIEYKDRFKFFYTTFKKRTILFSDILNYQYPVAHYYSNGKVIVHRLVLKNNEEIILTKYPGLKDFALRWRLAHKSDNEPVSHYIPNNKNLSFKHKYLYNLETYVVLFGLGVWCLDVWKIIEGNGSSFHYIMLFLLLFCVYGFTRTYTSFYIADNMFIMTNYLVPRLNVSIPMSEIKWMMFQEEIVIYKNNGDSIIAYHKLSDDQLMEFEAEVRAMGIAVVR